MPYAYGMADDKAKTTRESDKFMLRFPQGMRDRIADVAKAAGRSMNAEIVARLESTFASQRELFSPGELMDALTRIESGVAEVKKTVARSQGKLSPTERMREVIAAEAAQSKRAEDGSKKS